MRTSLLLAAVILIASGSQTLLAGDAPPVPKQFCIIIRAFEGDPLGSVAFGTQKCLVSTKITVMEDRDYSLLSGDASQVSADPLELLHIPVGLTVRAKVRCVKAGKVQLDVTITNTTKDTRTKDRTQFHSDSLRTFTTAQLREVVKLRGPNATLDQHQWVELSVEEIDPWPFILILGSFFR